MLSRFVRNVLSVFIIMKKCWIVDTFTFLSRIRWPQTGGDILTAFMNTTETEPCVFLKIRASRNVCVFFCYVSKI